ncbi:MAG: glycosyltransferase family 2 protein [Rubrobacteraceae bacterium]
MIPAPENSLRVCVVVPARDEEALITACLEALATQEGVSTDQYEVLLVLDRCADATAERARKVARRNPDLRLRFLEGPGRGAGHARRVGMETACERLMSIGRPGGLIASTDADTVVAGDWLAAQIEANSRGARAIGGRISLNPEGLSDEVYRWRERQVAVRRGETPGDRDACEHRQFSGASLALTAEAYREIGGLEPLSSLEDEYLEATLVRSGIRIERPLSVRVTTSSRLDGRAERGLSRDLALASWFSRNTYWRRDLEGIKTPSRETTTVILAPTGDETPVPESVLRTMREGLANEVVLPGREGVYFVTPQSDEIRTSRVEGLESDFDMARGPGDLLWRVLSATSGDTVVFVDARAPDLPERVRALTSPLREREELHFVQGFESETTSALSEALARPWIQTHAPELAGLFDPLSSEFAARRNLLESLAFPVGEGFVLAFVIDAARALGATALAQVELSSRSQNNRISPETARAVFAALEARRRGGSAPGSLVVPGRDGLEIRRVPTEERPPLVSSEQKRRSR